MPSTRRRGRGTIASSSSKSGSSASTSTSGAQKRPRNARGRGIAEKGGVAEEEEEEEGQEEMELEDDDDEEEEDEDEEEIHELDPTALAKAIKAVEGKKKSRRTGKGSTSTPGSAALLALLKRTHLALGSVPEPEDASDLPIELDEIKDLLLSPAVISSASKAIRRSAAVCFIHILTLTAPEAPYGDEDMRSVLRLLLQQLRGFPTDPRDEAYDDCYTILEGLQDSGAASLYFWADQRGQGRGGGGGGGENDGDSIDSAGRRSLGSSGSGSSVR